jgi:hypothetical protein
VWRGAEVVRRHAKTCLASKEGLPIMRKTIALALLLGACSSLPRVTGNELGGVMPWSGEDESDAFKAAQAHCEKYSRSARITQVATASGKAKGVITFVCERV